MLFSCDTDRKTEVLQFTTTQHKDKDHAPRGRSESTLDRTTVTDTVESMENFMPLGLE